MKGCFLCHVLDYKWCWITSGVGLQEVLDYKWCRITSGVGLQVLPFKDDRNIGSIHRFLGKTN